MLRDYWRDLAAGTLVALAAVLFLAGGGGRTHYTPSGVPVQRGELAFDQENSSPQLRGNGQKPDLPGPARDTAPTGASENPGRVQTTDTGRDHGAQANPKTRAVPLAGSDASPVATAVESRPLPIPQMSGDQVQQTVSEYRRWVTKGEIQMVLDSAKVTPQQMADAIDCYILELDGTGMITVTRVGESKTLGALPTGRLMGDLSTAKWPPVVNEAARRWFGALHRARAGFLLRPECELEVYRLVAAQSPKPGSTVRLELRPLPSGGAEVAFTGLTPPEQKNQ